MKHPQPENGVEEAPAKRSKLDENSAETSEFTKNFDLIQQKIQKLDEECAQEQMQVQRKYDRLKKPFFEERQSIIDTIPNFWAETFSHHPALSNTTEHDMPLLNLLKKIDLDDNLDDNGSYRVSFIFDDAVKEYFEPTTLTKEVKFEANEEEIIHCTEIKWKEGMNPILKVERRSSGNEEEDDEWSIFEWFSKEPPLNRPDLGEVIRREIWHSPLAYYMDVGYEYEDEEEFEDEEEEEDEE